MSVCDFFCLPFHFTDSGEGDKQDKVLLFYQILLHKMCNSKEMYAL